MFIEKHRSKLGDEDSADIQCSRISENSPNHLDSIRIQHCQSNKKDKGLPFLGQRHCVALWGFTFTFLVNVHRTSLSVAIVSMVNHTHITEIYTKNNSSISCVINSTFQDVSETFQVEGEFTWDSQTQGTIMSVSFFSYIFGNLLGGRTAEIWGVKRTLFCGTFFTALFVILTPFTARWNLNALLVDQFARGFSQGFLVPPFYVAMANWFPRKERGLLSGLSVCGYTFGSVVGGIVTGVLCDIPDAGWPSVFYVFGGFNAILCIPFICFFYEMPQNHPHISKQEINYIIDDQETVMTQNRPPVPWKRMFGSLKVLALLIGMFGFYWGMTEFMVLHPTYMSTILHYSMTQNGLASFLPQLVMLFGSALSSFLCGWISKKDVISVDKLRKYCNIIYAVGFSLCLIGIILAKYNRIINMIFYVLSLFCTGIGFSGIMIVSGDMTPTFSGSLFGFLSAVSTLAPVVLPVIVGLLTKQETLEEWHHVFYLHIAVVLGCAFVFHVFGSAEVQPWNSQDTKE